MGQAAGGMAGGPSQKDKLYIEHGLLPFQQQHFRSEHDWRVAGSFRPGTCMQSTKRSTKRGGGRGVSCLSSTRPVVDLLPLRYACSQPVRMSTSMLSHRPLSEAVQATVPTLLPLSLPRWSQG